MEYAVKYSPAALDDLRAIYSYIAYKLLSPREAENRMYFLNIKLNMHRSHVSFCMLETQNTPACGI